MRTVIIAFAVVVGLVWVTESKPWVRSGHDGDRARSRGGGRGRRANGRGHGHADQPRQRRRQDRGDDRRRRVRAFNNLDVGGPYQLVAELSGYKDFQANDLFLNAGKTVNITISMKIEEEVIKVESTAMTRSTSNRTVITAQDVEDLPSITRDPKDLVRRTPDADVEGTSPNNTMSIGGLNNRFNSITVDGVREDDDFGLNSSGYPTNRAPISLSAVQEMAVESAPFDVRYTKFMGGNVNIITKTGTNDIHGSLFAHVPVGRARRRPDRLEPRQQRQLPGGPLRRRRRRTDRQEQGALLPGDRGPDRDHAQRLRPDGLDRAQRHPEGDAAGDGDGAADRPAGLQLQRRHPEPRFRRDRLQAVRQGRLAAIDNKNRVVVSYQHDSGGLDIGPSSSFSTLQLSSDAYNNYNALDAGTIRLYSDWTDKLSTSVEFDTKIVIDAADAGSTVRASWRRRSRTQEGGTILIGPDEFRQTNFLDNDVYHGKAELNYLAGANLVTAGVEYEVLHIDDDFVTASSGLATYASVAAFQAMTPSSISYSNDIDGNPNDAAAKWNSGDLAGYIQDQIKLSDRAHRAVRSAHRDLQPRRLDHAQPGVPGALQLLEHGDAQRSQHPDAARRRVVAGAGQPQRARRRRHVQRRLAVGVGVQRVLQRRRPPRRGVLVRPLGDQWLQRPQHPAGPAEHDQGGQRRRRRGRPELPLALDLEGRRRLRLQLPGGDHLQAQLHVQQDPRGCRVGGPPPQPGVDPQQPADRRHPGRPRGVPDDVRHQPRLRHAADQHDEGLRPGRERLDREDVAVGADVHRHLRVRARARHHAGEQLAVGVELRQRRGDRPQQLAARAVGLQPREPVHRVGDLPPLAGLRHLRLGALEEAQDDDDRAVRRGALGPALLVDVRRRQLRQDARADLRRGLVDRVARPGSCSSCRRTRTAT